MDLDARELEDQERLWRMRDKMRAHVEQVCADYMARANPVTPAEVRSHLWTVAVADRTLRQLCGLPQRRRPRTEPRPEPRAEPRAEPRSGPILAPPPPPVTSHEKVDARAAEPKEEKAPLPDPPPATEHAPSPQQQLKASLAAADDKIDQVTRVCAEWAGLWPDGTPFEDAGPDWRAHTDARPLPVEVEVDVDRADTDDEAALARLMTGEILRRCNAIARQSARFLGCWFDGARFDERDPDFWAVSANFGSGINRPSAQEASSPSCLPWWIVKTRPT